jgi:hypothetical protein
MKDYLRILKTTHALNLLALKAENLRATIKATRPEYEESATVIRKILDESVSKTADLLDSVLSGLVGDLCSHDLDDLDHDSVTAVQEAGYANPIVSEER